MADFEAAIEAQLSGRTVKVSHLARFDFRSGEVRLWPGFGDLLAGGEIWQGIRNLGSVGQISQAADGSVQEVQFQLAGTVEMLANLSEDAEESEGRDVRLYLQFFQVDRFDEDGNWVDWQALSDPVSLFWGTMGPLSVQRPQHGVGEQAVRIISVSATDSFFNRSRPPFAFYTDLDQRARAPTDKIFVNMARSQVNVLWPRF